MQAKDGEMGNYGVASVRCELQDIFGLYFNGPCVSVSTRLWMIVRLLIRSTLSSLAAAIPRDISCRALDL